jgi:hypothetical protein
MYFYYDLMCSFFCVSILIVVYVPFCVFCLFLCECYWATATGISGNFLITVTYVFPCFFLSCKANVRV